jgi:prophage regulatory protein
MADTDTPQNTELIRGWRAISAATGKSRVQLWRDVRAGTFPPPLELGPNSIGWVKAEVDAWLRSRRRRYYRSGGAV